MLLIDIFVHGADYQHMDDGQSSTTTDSLPQTQRVIYFNAPDLNVFCTNKVRLGFSLKIVIIVFINGNTLLFVIVFIEVCW